MVPKYLLLEKCDITYTLFFFCRIILYFVRPELSNLLYLHCTVNIGQILQVQSCFYRYNSRFISTLEAPYSVTFSKCKFSLFVVFLRGLQFIYSFSSECSRSSVPNVFLKCVICMYISLIRPVAYMLDWTDLTN